MNLLLSPTDAGQCRSDFAGRTSIQQLIPAAGPAFDVLLSPVGQAEPDQGPATTGIHQVTPAATSSGPCVAKPSCLLQVRLCRRILQALASNSHPQQQEREAVTLLKASLDPSTLLATSSLRDFEACLDTVLFHSHRPAGLLQPTPLCQQAPGGGPRQGGRGGGTGQRVG